MRRGAQLERPPYTEKQKFSPDINLFGLIFFSAPGFKLWLMVAFAKLRNPHFALKPKSPAHRLGCAFGLFPCC